MIPRNVYPETATLGDKPTRDRNSGGRNFSAKVDFGVDPITRNLRRVYDEVAAEPIPDDLKRLLEQLDGRPLEGDRDA
jgi:Anti-sigma factor NepR